LAEPDACFVTRMALPFGSTRALPTAQAIRLWPLCLSVPSASLRSAVLTCPCRKLCPAVLMVKSAQDRAAGDLAKPLNRPTAW
jgi:hypothetical protein